MNRVRVVFSLIVLACFAGNALADESWFLLSQRSGEDTVAVSTGSQLHTVATPGRVGSYGQFDHVMGFLSYQTQLARYVLTRVDQRTQTVSASVIINMSESVTPMHWMSGAIPDVMLTEQFAYFVSYSHTEGAGGPGRNPNGGFFDLDRVTLADGQMEQFQLPKDCVNPRLVEFEGMPLVYSWEGFCVARFDVAKRTVETLVSDSDVGDIVIREGNAKYVRRGPETAIFSDYAMVPGRGAFRLSRVGELQQVLNADLRLVPLPRRTVKVAEAGEQPEIRLGRFRGALVIGVVRVLPDHLELKYIDPATFSVQWQVTLPKSASIASLYGLSDNAVIYLDQATASVMKVTQQGTTVLQKVSADGTFLGVKVLSVGSKNPPGAPAAVGQCGEAPRDSPKEIHGELVSCDLGG